MSETKLVKDIQLEIGAREGLRLFRNNVGRLQAKDGTWVQFGLCPGSSDLIGWKSIVVTPDMVGERIAFFVALECKSPLGVRRAAQENFLAAVEHAGGMGDFVRSVKEACQVLNIAEENDTVGP